MKRYGSLNAVESLQSWMNWQKFAASDLPKRVQLVAAFDLGQRLARETLAKQKIDSPELVNELVGGEMRMLRKEAMRVFCWTRVII